MRTQEAVDFFKTQQGVADALGIKQSSVAKWGEYPPDLRQLQLYRATLGKLRAEPEVIEKFGEPNIAKAKPAGTPAPRAASGAGTR